MDIQHDRAGFYLLTGCTMWVPSVYTSASLYLVNHPVHLSTGAAAAIFLAGWAAIYANFDADNQRQCVARAVWRARGRCVCVCVCVCVCDAT